MNFYKAILAIVITLTISSCNPKLNVPEADHGTIDASNYVAIGGALTAGYSNGALYYVAQQNSYANLVAEQLKTIGGNDFNIPYVSQNSIGIGNLNNAPSELNYRTDCKGETSLGPVKIASQGDLSIFTTNIYSSQNPYNNMGVPDVKTTDMETNGYSNPFYARMSSSISSSILSDALAKKPTFFTVALGINDVLNYALKGAASNSITPLNGGIGVGFESSITSVINQLTANGAKGVIANIPSIKTLPYFNTIAYNALKLTDSLANVLTQAYYNLDSTKFYAGNNGFIIEDATIPFLGTRQAKEGELILLNVPLDSVKCYKWGSLTPIPDRYVLTLAEIETIETAITNFNTVLKHLAETKNLAFVDMNSFFTKVKTGFSYNGVTINATFVSGGAFSLDGLNLTPRGNALLANEFIKAINATYQSTLPQINANKYPGIIFP